MDHSSSNTEIAPGFIVDGRYEIIQQIGSGGFSTVYRAKHIKMNRDAAIKVLSAELIDDGSNSIERFMREAQICAAFSHPNVVIIYDLGTIPETEQPYIAMELLHGHDLATEIRKNGPLSKARVYRLFRPILDAIGEGNAAGIVHRDLKPENLFIVNPGMEDEVMKVMDFGISSMHQRNLKRLTMNGEVMGTPRFLAPEYIKDSVVCPAGDVYQMALIISEALSGVQAVSDNSMAALLMHAEGKIEICDFLKQGAVGEVFRRACCVDRTMRYQNCKEFCDAFTSVAQYFETSSLPKLEITQSKNEEIVSNVVETNHVETKHGYAHLVPIILSIVLVIFCAIGVVWWLMNRSESQSDIEQVADIEQPPVIVSEPQVVPEAKTGFQELALVESLQFCKLNVTPELEALREEAKNSSEAKEKLGVYLMHLPKCRENDDEAFETFENVELHRDPEAMYYHGVLGLKRWSQRVHIMTADEASTFKQFQAYIWEAAQSGFLPAIAGSFQHLENAFEHKEMAEMILDALNDEDGNFSDTRSWLRIAQNLQLLISMDDGDYIKIYRKVLDKFEKMILKEKNNSLATTIRAMSEAKSNPDESYKLFKQAAESGSAEANRILADVYMHTMTDKMTNETVISLQAFKALQNIVRKKLKSLDETDRINLVSYYIEHSGSDELDVYSFYRNFRESSDELANVVLNRIRDNAVNHPHVRHKCNMLAESVGVDVKWEGEQIENIFPDSSHSKAMEALADCYRSALEQGNDFSESNFDNYEFSTGYTLYLLYKNAFDKKNKEIQDKMLGTLIFAGMHGDGISAGVLAQEYQKGEILPIDEEKMHEWADRCTQSQYCRDCMKIELALCSLCDKCASLNK